ncbi:phosphopantetheine-binding protein [Nocardia nova SH22a]|uniref:Phosphopantetheine-binding protein n=1 Tax=Nocardia nova SH22a TaxID=1415166 RepID=W5TFR8_9NOCA|nr:acyl carrier protein [Nocardia nova]AHH17989.1 phosphopantetheine-binding protein [Nocardia nova SH22a]
MSTTETEIIHWCQRYIGGVLGLAPESLDPTADFDRLGVDSAMAVSLLIEIEERYGVDLPPEALFDKPNLEAVAAYLVELGALAPR